MHTKVGISFSIVILVDHLTF